MEGDCKLINHVHMLCHVKLCVKMVLFADKLCVLLGFYLILELRC